MPETSKMQAIDISAPDSGYRVRLLRYALAGLSGTALHYSILFALLGLVSPVVASTCGAVAGALVNYLLARHWVFGRREQVRFPLPKFVLVAAVSLGVNAAILSLAILAWPILPSQLLATGCAFLAGYVLNDLWSFNDNAAK